MTRIGKYIAKDTFKRMFPEAVYNTFPEYDFVYKGKTYKANASAMSRKNSWTYTIRGNQDPDIHVFMAFDNGKDLNLMHMWFIPREVYKKFAIIVVYASTISRWDDYRVDAEDL